MDPPPGLDQVTSLFLLELPHAFLGKGNLHIAYKVVEMKHWKQFADSDINFSSIATLLYLPQLLLLVLFVNVHIRKALKKSQSRLLSPL